MNSDRLLGYPYVVVRVGCTKCGRSGSYQLARLAERYGANIRLTELLNMLSADCKLRGGSKGFVGSHLTCGAIFPDLGKGGPPDTPPAAPLRVVGGRK